MSRMLKPLSALILLVFYSSGVLAQNADIETLKKLNRGFLDASVNKDTSTLANILADDFVLINPGGVKMNRSNCLSNILLKNQQIVSVNIDSLQVRLLTGDIGLVAAWTTNVIEAGNKRTTFKICYQDVYMKRNERWQAVAAHVALLGTE